MKIAEFILEIIAIILRFRLDPEKVEREIHKAAKRRMEERTGDSYDAIKEGDDEKLVEAARDLERDRSLHRMQDD